VQSHDRRVVTRDALSCACTREFTSRALGPSGSPGAGDDHEDVDDLDVYRAVAG
jgi:hypothetical protein